MALSATRLEAFMGELLTVPAAPAEPDEAEVMGPLAADELLVEEVSIDGMCGVY
jgi:mycofactocin precursor